MNKAETARVLGKAAAFDRRTVGEVEVRAWHEALSDVDYPDALEAVTMHYTTSTDFLMPMHIRRNVDEIYRRHRAERNAEAHQRVIDAQPHSFGSPTALIAALRATLPPGRPDKLRGPHWLSRQSSRGQDRT